MVKQLQSAEDFSLDRIYISSERFREIIDIKNVTIEVNIFENIHMPYLTGSIMILDDNALFTAADFQGTERLYVEFSLPINGASSISKTFIMSRIQKIEKSNDNTTMLLFDLIEDNGFYNNVQCFSKSYDGTGEQIIEKILQDKLSKSLYKRLNMYKPSFQKSFRLIVPYMNPFQAVRMVLDKMTTENGSPYYLYSTINSDDLVLADLDTIMSRTPFNRGEPFQYDQTVSNDKNNSVLLQSRAIYNMEAPNQEDTLLLSELGATSATFSTVDTTTGEYVKFDHSLNTVYQQLLDASVIPSDQKSVMLDNSFIADPNGFNTSKLVQYRSRHITQAAGGRTYPYQSNVDNWTYESDPSAYRLRMSKFAIEQLLLKNTYELMVPGLRFLGNNILSSVGNQLDVVVYKNQIVDELTDPTDHKRSGSFVINTKRHIFNIVDEKHVVSLSCSRISNREVT